MVTGITIEEEIGIIHQKMRKTILSISFINVYFRTFDIRVEESENYSRSDRTRTRNDLKQVIRRVCLCISIA